VKIARHGPVHIWPDDLKGIVVRRVVEIWQRGNANAIDDLHTPHFQDHRPAGRAADNEGLKAGVRELYRGFPNFAANIDDLIIDWDSGKVVVRRVGGGTHYGEFMSAQPSDRQISFRGIEILRIQGGRIVERRANGTASIS
jgi:predicted ester cyclase